MQQSKDYNTLVSDLENVRNIAIIAHVDHGKTTMSDCFLAGADSLTSSAVGDRRMLDFREDEKARGITIEASCVCLQIGSTILNFIDTPGHCDFGGEVTSAMRAIDGAVVVVDVVEGPKAQTETVLKQALDEDVKLVLFINKTDRLFSELKLTYEDCLKHLNLLVKNINELLKSLNPDAELFTMERVVVGSALHKWAVGPYSKIANLASLKEIYDFYTSTQDLSKENIRKQLEFKADLFGNLLHIVKEKLPCPLSAQKNKIAKIWTGDSNDPVFKTLQLCDKNAPVVAMVTSLFHSKTRGNLAIVRCYSGTILKNTNLLTYTGLQRVLKVNVFKGREPVEIPAIYAGNIGVIQGIQVNCGQILTTYEQIPPLKKLLHRAEPVITVAISPKKATDLSKLKEVIDRVTAEDITLTSSFSEETGEHLLAGVGKLQLEVVLNSITREDKIELTVTPPQIIYRESCEGTSQSFEGSSTNKHNKFKLSVFRLNDEIIELLKKTNYKANSEALKNALIDIGFEKDYARKIMAIKDTNLLINATKGVQYLDDTKPHIVLGFNTAMQFGPSLRKSSIGVCVLLEDADLHVDWVHRSPAQIGPIINKLIHAGMQSAKTEILEPVAGVYLLAPSTFESACTREILRRRGNVNEITSTGSYVTVLGDVPVRQLDGFAEALLAITSGKLNWRLQGTRFVKVPEKLKQTLKENYLKTRKTN